MNHLHPGLLGLCADGRLLARLVGRFLQLSYQALAMIPELAMAALNATSESLPLMPCWGRLREEISQQLLLLLDEGNLVLDAIFLAVKEMGLVPKQQAHALSCTK